MQPWFKVSVMDRLTSLEVFGRVVETGGFSAAGRKLNMSTTMVANHINALEEELGVLLLHRTTRKVTLTETGRFYHERSSAILADLLEANEAAAQLSSRPQGKLRIYINTSMVQFVAPIVEEFMATYSQVSVEIEIGERMVDMAQEGYDLAIRMVLPETNLITRKLASWRHVLVCAPDYIARLGQPRVLADLAQHNCMQYAHYAYGDTWRFLNRKGVVEDVRITGGFTSNSADLLRDLAIRGCGLFFAPSVLIMHDIEAGRLMPVMTDYQGVEFTMNAMFPSRNHLPTKVRLFIDLMVQRFAPEERP